MICGFWGFTEWKNRVFEFFNKKVICKSSLRERTKYCSRFLSLNDLLRTRGTFCGLGKDKYDLLVGKVRIDLIRNWPGQVDQNSGINLVRPYFYGGNLWAPNGFKLILGPGIRAQFLEFSGNEQKNELH